MILQIKCSACGGMVPPLLYWNHTCTPPYKKNYWCWGGRMNEEVSYGVR